MVAREEKVDDFAGVTELQLDDPSLGDRVSGKTLRRLLRLATKRCGHQAPRQSRPQIAVVQRAEKYQVSCVLRAASGLCVDVMRVDHRPTHFLRLNQFRSIRSPERQAEAVVGRLVNLGALRRNPNRPASVRTVANYYDCLLQIARRIAREGRELRDLTPETAVECLRSRTADLGQKALDVHRQALQAMLVHVSRRLPEGERLTVVRSGKPRRTGGGGRTAPNRPAWSPPPRTRATGSRR